MYFVLKNTSSIALADLLSSLEAGMGGAAGASDRLRSQVHRMDGYMQQQRSRHITRKDVPPQSHTGDQQHNILPMNQPSGTHSQQYEESAMLGPHAGSHNGSDYQFTNGNNNNNNSTSQQASPPQQQQQHQQQQPQMAPPPESFYSFPAEVFEGELSRIQSRLSIFVFSTVADLCSYQTGTGHSTSLRQPGEVDVPSSHAL